MNLNERLKELRRESGYTLKMVSEGIGIPLSTYSNYEQGIREPSVEIIKRICKFFDVSSDYLLGLED